MKASSIRQNPEASGTTELAGRSEVSYAYRPGVIPECRQMFYQVLRCFIVSQKILFKYYFKIPYSRGVFQIRERCFEVFFVFFLYATPLSVYYTLDKNS